MTANLSAAQVKTLRTIVAAGGTMDGWTGQKGFSTRSLPALVRAGLLVSLGTEVTESGEYLSYNRHQVTDAGRAHLNDLDGIVAAPAPAPAPAPSAEVAIADEIIDAEIVDEPAPAANGIIYLPADHRTNWIDDAGYAIDVTTNQRLAGVPRWNF